MLVANLGSEMCMKCQIWLSKQRYTSLDRTSAELEPWTTKTRDFDAIGDVVRLQVESTLVRIGFWPGPDATSKQIPQQANLFV